MGGIRWTDEEYRAWKAKGNNRAAVQVANLERDAGDGVAPKNASKEVDSRVRINFHSRRRRAIDPDGLYSKAAIDGLRAGGLLVDDSARYVEAVSYSQEKSKVEETIITVELVK